jgi:chromosome partitioning protein
MSDRRPTRFPPVGLAELQQLSTKASDLMTRARDAALEPNRQKTLRKWSISEVAELLGTNADTLARRLKKKPELPQGEESGRKRLFTLAELHNIQADMGLLPRRDPATDAPVTMAVCNFKGGVAKTTTAIHLGQYLALKGYRVLMLDLDAQASLTQMFGILPHLEVESRDTVLPFLEGPKIAGDNWTGTLAGAVRKTHWHNLDLIPANLGLYGAEFALAGRAIQEPGFPFYRVLRDGIATVSANYDMVVIDTAPALSFVNSNALFAADGLVLALPPAMIDLGSAAQFFELMAQLIEQTNSYESTPKIYDPFAILISKFKPADEVHQTLAGWIRTRFEDQTVLAPMLESTVLQKVGPEILTAYEVASYEGDRRTFQRALQSLNDVNGELEAAIRRRWPSRRQVVPERALRAAAG